MKRNKNMEKKLQKLLYRSFDEPLSKEEQVKLKTALKSSEELLREKEKITWVHNAISAETGQKFSPFFADRIMRKIRMQKEDLAGKIDDFNISLILSFRKIALAGVVTVLLLLSTNFISQGGLSVDKAMALQQITIEDTWSLNTLISEVVK